MDSFFRLQVTKIQGYMGKRQGEARGTSAWKVNKDKGASVGQTRVYRVEADLQH